MHSANSLVHCCLHDFLSSYHISTAVPSTVAAKLYVLIAYSTHCWLVIQERYESLCEALARDPSGLEASDRQQMERLAATLHR